MILDSQKVLTFSNFLKFGLKSTEKIDSITHFIFIRSSAVEFRSFKIFYFDPSYLNFLDIDL